MHEAQTLLRLPPGAVAAGASQTLAESPIAPTPAPQALRGPADGHWANARSPGAGHARTRLNAGFPTVAGAKKTRSKADLS